MEPIVARRSVRSYSWALVVGIAVGLLSHQLGVPTGSSLLLGLLVAVGPTAFGLVRAVLTQGEVLRIDETGIVDHRLGVGLIPWANIATVHRRGHRLYVGITNPETLGIRKTIWRRMNQPLGRGSEELGLLLRLQNLDVPADKIAAVIDERLSAGDRKRENP